MTSEPTSRPRLPAAGVIGLGEIGYAMASDIAAAGASTVGFDIDADKRPPGVILVDSARAVGAAADVILIALPSQRALETVTQELLAVARPGQVIVENGTTDPVLEERLAAAFASHRVAFVDAPITLRQGGRSFLVGGDPGQPGLAVLGALGRVLRIGPVGSGQRLKLVNQLLVFGQTALQAEAIELARRAGVNARTLSEDLHHPLGERLFDDDWDGPDQLELCRKDIALVLGLAEASGARAPMATLVAEILSGAGHGILPAIARYWRR